MSLGTQRHILRSFLCFLFLFWLFSVAEETDARGYKRARIAYNTSDREDDDIIDKRHWNNDHNALADTVRV